MKLFNVLALLAILPFSHSAFADNGADACAGKPKPDMILHYPSDIVSEVTSGKVTATVRMGVRCFAKGDVLVLTDPKTSAALGKVKLEDVIISQFTSISPKVVARTGEATMDSLQKKLISIYGDAVRTGGLTEYYFSFVK